MSVDLRQVGGVQSCPLNFPGRSKDSWKDRERDEEEKEARKAERRARDKEASYQERLRKWESREAKR